VTAPTLLSVALHVADALGPPWRVPPSSPVQVGERVEHPAGYRITLWADADRVEIIGHRLPGTVGDEHHATAEATPARVLAAVQRLLPRYIADYDAGLRQLRARAAERVQRVAAMDHLRALVPGADVTPDDVHLRWREEQLGRGEVTVALDGTVRLEIEGLAPAVCARMLDAMVGAVQ
jgi:hypothetical protein